MVRLESARTPDSAPKLLSSTVKESPSRRAPTQADSTSFVVQSRRQQFSQFHHTPKHQQSRKLGQINSQHKQQEIHRQATAELVHEVSFLDFLKHINHLNLLLTSSQSAKSINRKSLRLQLSEV